MYPYFSLTQEDIKQMLESLGLNSIEDLFSDIPKDLKLKRPLNIPASKSEMEITNYLTELSKMNVSSYDYPTFLGAGAYDHYIPSVIPQIASRSEFLTSYTPYQPEISQGTLQYIFEFQTMISNLTGMEYSNASLYDQGTALAEAAIMTAHHAKKKKVLVSKSISPWSREVLKTYTHAQHIEMEEIEIKDGVTSAYDLEKKLTDDVGAVLVQNPNFFGNIENVAEFSKVVHSKKKCYLVSSVDPSSLGTLKKPSDCGVDVVVGEAQTLGIPLSFGGPYLGFMAVNKEFLRKIPGRIVGQTVDRDGKRCWVLTLSAREQHIKRDKATSNICSNQGVNTLMATIYMSLLGKQGLMELSKQCIKKAHYAYEKLLETGKFEKVFNAPFYKEFAIKCKKPVCTLNKKLLENGIIGGFDLGKYYTEFENVMLIAVTEKRTKEEIDKLCKVLEEA